MGELSAKIKKSGSWQLFEVFGLVVCQLLYFSIMARILDKSDFGLMAIANGFIAFGSVFTEGGMGAALIQRKNVTYKHINAAIQGGVLFGVLFIIILNLSASFISIFFDNEELKSLIRVISLNFLLLAISGVSLGMLHKTFKFKASSIVNVLACTVGYSIGIILGFLNYGVWSLVWGTLIYSLLKTIGYLFFAPIKIEYKIYYKEWKELFSFGFGMILLRVNNFFSNKGMVLILGKIFTPSVLGVFDRALFIKSLPSTYLGSVLDKVMFPAMSEIQDEEIRLFKVYQHGLGVSNSLLMPLSVYLIFFSPELVHLFLGSKWDDAVLPLQIMFLVLPLSISARMADSVIRAKGYIYLNVKRKFIYVIILLLSVGYGGANHGIVGASIGVTGSYIINYFMMIFIVKKIFNKNFKTIFFKPLQEAFKLSIAVVVILFIYSLFFNSSTVDFVSFIVLTMVFILAILIICVKKPSLLGDYIKITIERIFDKRGKN